MSVPMVMALTVAIESTNAALTHRRC